MISTKQLTWNKESKTFSAFISDFGKNFQFERIYPDACDEGITVLSDKTGKTAVFYVKGIQRNYEDGIQYWILEADQKSIKQNPTLKNVKIQIWND